MHRSRPSVLAIFAAVAACSTRQDPDATAVLSRDPSLVSTLEARQKVDVAAMPDACGTVAVAAKPAAAGRGKAEALARQAYDAELLGNTQQARSLLRRAVAIDGTDKSATYHLARTSEALGDRTGAVTAYCRYLALTPPATEAADARQRVVELSKFGTVVATGGGSAVSTPRAVATVRRASRSQSPRPIGVATRSGTARSTSSAAGRGTYSASGVGDGMDAAGTQGGAITSPAAGSVNRSSDGDVVATGRELPPVEQPVPTSRSQSRGPSRVQTAGIGAVAGAILGAATGRNVKSAMIGAAAGGIIGTVVGGQMRPAGSGLRPWATSAPQWDGMRSTRRLVRYRPAA